MAALAIVVFEVDEIGMIRIIGCVVRIFMAILTAQESCTLCGLAGVAVAAACRIFSSLRQFVVAILTVLAKILMPCVGEEHGSAGIAEVVAIGFTFRFGFQIAESADRRCQEGQDGDRQDLDSFLFQNSHVGLPFIAVV